MNDIKNAFLKAKRELFDIAFGEGLNPQQRDAVFTAKGPLLVLAGAGSGKTTVLVNRIVYLVKYGNAYFSETVPEDASAEMVEALREAQQSGAENINDILPIFITEPCPPWSVLAITFTNKAANEIKERLKSAFGDESVSSSIWAGTFHSVCVRILRKYGDRVGFNGFSIYDADDQKRLIAQCMKDLQIDEKRLAPRAVANIISSAKDSLRSPEELDIGRDPRLGDVKRIYALYQKKLSESGALDFDDIIMKTVQLLQENEDVRSYYQNKFKYVLVDEYQDTNHAQFVLTKLLSDKYRNIMVVGDDDQSIYRFRGATVENILDFDKTYPDAKVVKLEQNYRSTENILDAANAVISNNGKRHQKSLWSNKGKGERITLRRTEDQNEEGRYIIDKIQQGVRNKGRKYSDYAILFRINELARSLETSFAKSGVPYKILGGMRFYDRKEIKDMLAYISLVNNRSDNLRLKRIINEPKRKIGAATVDAIEQIAEHMGLNMFSVLERSAGIEALAKSAQRLIDFAELIKRAEELKSKPSSLIEELFIASGYRDMLLAEGFEGEGKLQNVNELIAGAIEYEARSTEAGVEPSLEGFLEEVSLVSDLDKYDESADAVVLMTVHSAKGLEFPIVFLAGMEDGIFPSEQNMQDEEQMSEERRLAYVAITRAKEKLFVTYTKNRMMYGRTSYNMLSSFIRREVPRSLIEDEQPMREPPRESVSYGYRPKVKQSYPELNRSPDIADRRNKGSSKFGLVSFEAGSRVSHSIFGAGTVISAKDMGGDVLYEVEFDTVGRKKLMATFAKLSKI